MKQITAVVEVLDCVDEQTAIATASAYLAYADQTDTFGYNPTIHQTRVFQDGDGPVAVEFTFDANLPSDDDVKRFMDEMAHLSKVMSVEWGEE